LILSNFILVGKVPPRSLFLRSNTVTAGRCHHNEGIFAFMSNNRLETTIKQVLKVDPRQVAIVH
jgi:hypothetical protein